MALFTALVASADEKKNQLIGSWDSVRMSDKDLSDRIKVMGYEFRKDGTFDTWAQINKRGKMAFTGKYEVDAGKIKMTISGKGSRTVPFTIKDGLLR